MNATSSAVIKTDSQSPAPIVDAGSLAPVVAAFKGITVSNDVVESYCAKITAGKPTGKILPAKLSEIEFSREQREMIRGARATHKLNCMVGKRELLAKLRGKHIQILGFKSNAKDSRGSLRWADEKVKPVSNTEIFGADPKVSANA